MLLTDRVFKFALAAILAASINLPASAQAQTPCPPSSGSGYSSGDCVNNDSQSYTTAPLFSVDGIYKNDINGVVYAKGLYFTALSVGAFDNLGTVTAIGNGASVNSGIKVDTGDFTNSGTVTATNEQFSSGIRIEQGSFINNAGGVVDAIGNESGPGFGAGIRIELGDFINNAGGVVNAYGEEVTSDYGIGILIEAGDFTNNADGKVNAHASGAGMGIIASDGSFINSGYVSAIGESTLTSGGGAAIRVSKDFTNSGQVYAEGSGTIIGDLGIRLENGNFYNSGTLEAVGKDLGLGVFLDAGNFNNSGTVVAKGDNVVSGSGAGIWLKTGDFDNSGTVTASSINFGTGILLEAGDFVNNAGGTVKASGSDHGTAIDLGPLGVFTNSGTVYASGTSGDSVGIFAGSGFTNSGTVTADASDYAYGIYIDTGGFTNDGTVFATGSAGTSGGGGSAIRVDNGGFINSGTIYASGASSGAATDYVDGIAIINGDFDNSGTIYASGTGSGSGIWLNNGDFDNSGTIYASDSGSGNGAGILIENAGNFTNSGTLNLMSNGGSALHFFSTSSQSFFAESGSSLIISGYGPGMVFGTTGTLNIDSGARLTVLSANGVVDDSQTFVVAQNISGTSDTFELTNSNSAVFSFKQGWNDDGSGTSGDYQVTVTREGWASEMTGGEGGKFVKSLEDYFIKHGINVGSGSSAESWLYLLNDINSGATRAEVKRLGEDGARLNTAQATGQSLRLVQDASRRTTSIFNKELSKQMSEGTAAPAAGGGESSASVWFSPFYLSATQDSSDRSISSVDGDWWGFSLGAGYSPQDYLNFGLGFHFLSGDIDAGRSYQADSTAWGLDLGFAANLGSGRYRPLLTGTVSHTRHDYDQTRRADGNTYKSSPEIKVTTAALGLSQDFYPTEAENFIIRPKIGFDWTRTDMEGYTERGPGLRALSVDSEKYDSYRSEVGAALVWKPTAPVELELRAAWLHDFGDRTPILTSVARDVQGLNLYTPRSDNKRDSAAVGASASFDAGSGFSIGLDYDGQFNSDLDSHQVWGSLKYTF